MRTRSNSAFGAIIESARRTSRRFSLGPVNNRSETIDLETQIEAVKENKEVLKRLVKENFMTEEDAKILVGASGAD